MTSNSQIYERLLDKEDNQVEAVPHHHKHEKEFQGPLLSRIEEIKTSKQFLEECTYFIGLKEIYEIHSTCAYHESMPYCPIQVKINAPDIQLNLKADYLLQVWKKGGKKVYEKPLQGKNSDLILCSDPVSIWTISYDYLVYKPSARDVDSDYIHIVDLKHKNTTYLVKDFVQDPTFKYLTYADKQIYLASEQTIKVGFCKLVDDGFKNKSEVEDTLTIKIDPSISRVHGLSMTHFYHKHHDASGDLKYDHETRVIAALETQDQQIDFNFIEVKPSVSLNHGPSYEYKLIQYREVIKRKKYDANSDKIVSYQAVFTSKGIENTLVAVVKRQSGLFDLYYSGSRVYTSKKVKILQIDLTYDAIYLDMQKDFIKSTDPLKKLEKPELQIVDPDDERVRMIELSWENEISYENSKYNEHYTFDNLFFQKIKKYCKLFSCFCLVSTVLVVSHGNMISLFSILSQKWMKHFFFDSQIAEIYRNAHHIEVIALFEDQTVRVIKQQKMANAGEENEPWLEDEDLRVKIEDKIVDTHQDREDNKFTVFVTQRKGDKEFGVYTMFEHKLFDITSQFFGEDEEPHFHSRPNIVFLYSHNDLTEFILQHGHKIDLYTIEFREDKPEEDENNEDELHEANNDKLAELEDEEGHAKKEHDAHQAPKFEMKPFIEILHSIDVASVDAHGHKGKSQIESKISDGVNFKMHTHGHGHHQPKLFLILSDHINIYKIDLQTSPSYKIVTFKDQNCIGFFLSDQNYLYTLCHKSATKSSGLRLYELENMIEKDQDYSLLLTSDLQVGCQGHIDFSHENERLIFQSSFEKIEVIPLLHRNTMSFIGMKDRSNYIATKVTDGKFIALSNKGKLYSWDVITGKLIIDANKAPSFKEYKEYDVYTWTDEDEDKTDTVYRKEWYSKVLLRKKLPIKNFDESTFHGHGGVEESLPNQVSYNHSIKKEFYEFKVIEIESDRSVKEQLSFVHCIQPDSVNYIYFSEDLQYMYERLKYERHFLYKRQPGHGANEVHWEQIHRFHRLPLDILNLTEYPFIFSPNFKKYIDLDDDHTKFIVRDTHKHEKVIIEIPVELMNAEDEKLEDVVRRFKWLSEDLIHIINHEGIERIVDITKDFKEVQFNFIPMYDPEICTKTHYMLDSPSYNLDECLKTLQKRYQYYKSSYNMKKSIDPTYDLYNDIFCLDYRIDDCKGSFEVDMSFSFLHWSLIEQLHDGKLYVEHLDHEMVALLFYNILPHGNTVLHKVHDKGDLMENLLKVAHPHVDDRSKISIHIPFLQNLDGKSPIHLCADYKEYRYINVILEYLAGYGIDHHSRAIFEILPIMIEHNLPNFIPYLESRIKQTERAKKITKGMLKVTNTNNICATSLWTGEHAIDELFQTAPIEQDVRLQYVDIPEFHCLHSEVGNEFVCALADSEDMGLFETSAVKKLIEFQWPIVLRHTILKLLIPYTIFLALYTCYIKEFDFDGVEGYNPYIKSMTMIALFVAVGYLLLIEIFQLYKNGLSYFFSVWNYLDIVPPTLLIIYMDLDISGVFTDDTIETQAILKGTMSLLIWIKFLYFLRIFESTGYLIRIIIQVCIDMRHFLLILLLSFIAFGEAIQSISDSNAGEGFTGYLGGIGYVYRMVLGDFGTDEEGFGTIATGYMWILFIMCSVLNMIIMMNLLIAIISESFANINSVSKQANYRERASIISENLYLVPAGQREAYCQKNTYLLMAIDTEQELLEHQETVDSKLKVLKQRIKANNKKLHQKIKKKLNKQHEEVLKLLGFGAGLASKLGGSKFGGSKFGGSIINAHHGAPAAGSHHH